jgi:hypothetical protein
MPSQSTIIITITIIIIIIIIIIIQSTLHHLQIQASNTQLSPSTSGEEVIKSITATTTQILHHYQQAIPGLYRQQT